MSTHQDDDLLDLIYRLNEAYDKAADPAIKEAISITAELANTVRHKLVKLGNSISEAIARKKDI
jgi:hypothetical protein